MRYLLLLIISLVLSFYGLHSSVSAQDNVTQKKWILTLSGSKAIPKVKTPAIGTMTLSLSGDTLWASGSFQDLGSNYQSTHIFFGAHSKFGNALFTLDATLNEKHRSGTFAKKKNRFVLNEIQKSYLLDGELFIAISTKSHQSGELRAPIQ